MQLWKITHGFKSQKSLHLNPLSNSELSSIFLNN
nr:MAG TPA: hypothetical protein [Caudoviricetes sp.]